MARQVEHDRNRKFLPRIGKLNKPVVWVTLLFCFFSTISAKDILSHRPFWQKPPHRHGERSSLFFRVLNRKQVQDLRLEQLFVDKPAFRLTLLVTHPWPNNYKALSHPLYIETSDVSFLKELSLFTDAYLASGHNLKVWLNGNRIRRVEFTAKSFYWDETSGDKLHRLTP